MIPDTPTDGRQVVNLAALRRVVCQLRLREDGELHALRSPSARRATEMVAIADLTGVARIEATLALVAKLMPTAPAEEIDELGPEQLVAIIELASNPAAAVEKYATEAMEAMDPNAARGATVREATSPETASDTYAPA